jgi:hypothetical protein
MSENKIKEAYTTQEWTQKEAYYVQAVSKIKLPADPNTKDVMRLESEIDQLLTEAMLDLAFIKRKYEALDMQMKLSEKETFSILKKNPPSALAGTKLTENDIKGMVVSYLKGRPVQNAKLDIYTMLTATEQRFIFIDTVVKMLTERKSSLIIDTGMLKIESNLSNTVQP